MTMAYEYTTERPKLLATGQDILDQIHANAVALLETNGRFQAHEAWHGVGGDTWRMLAALDYLVETGVLRQVSDDSVWAQHRVYVASPR